MSHPCETLEDYLATLSEKDRKKYQALLQSNSELKNELETISQTITEILAKKKQPKPVKPPRNNDSKNIDLVHKKQVMAEQQQLILALKSDVKAKKLELERTYNFEVIREKQDEFNDLKRIVEELKTEKQTLEKVKKDQDRFLLDKRASSQDLNKRADLQEKIREAKDTTKVLQDEKYDLEKEVNSMHTLVIGKNLALKNAQQKAENAARMAKGSEPEIIDKTTVQEAEAKTEELKKRKEEIMSEGDELMKILEKQKKDIEKQITVLEENCREKEKVVRVNFIKIREAKKEIFLPKVPTKTASDLPPKDSKNKENIPNSRADDAKPATKKREESCAPGKAKVSRGASVAKKDKKIIGK